MKKGVAKRELVVIIILLSFFLLRNLNLFQKKEVEF